MATFDTLEIRTTGLTVNGKTTISGNTNNTILVVSGSTGTLLSINDNNTDTLFSVATTGDTTNFSVLTGGTRIHNYLFDSNNVSGSTNQVLTSTPTGLKWSNGYSVTGVSTTYNITITSGTIVVLGDTNGGQFTVNLPTAVGNSATIIIKKINGTPSLIVDGSGDETIDGSATKTITSVNESVTLISNNTNWFII